MAHLSVYDPPAVGLGNKDKESEETKKEEMPQAMEEIDLEEGEIIDSGGEDSFRENEKVNDSHACEELDPSEKKKKKRRRKKKKDDDDQNDPEKPSKKKRMKYIDHDRVNEEDDWYPPLNPMPYPKKNLCKLINDGSLQQSGFDADYYSSDVKSSPSHDEDEQNEEIELQNRKSSWKIAAKRQNSERIMKKKRKDGAVRGIQDSKKRRLMITNKSRRKVVKLKQRAPLCKFFLEGRCSKGPDCPFSHATLPSIKKELCKFYVNGYCAKGENCLYMHEEFPCKFFHTGAKCYSESNCLFSHSPLTEETKRILDKYLESNKADDEKEEITKDASPQKQQQKRPSLLGSPPRHVKEAAETLQWRQYVSQMQQHQQHSRRFDRYNGPRNPLMLGPPLLARPPNFYMDTLGRSSKIPSLMSMPPISLPPLNPNLPMSPLVKTTGIYPKIPDGESSSQDEWENSGDFHHRNVIKNDKCANAQNSTSDAAVKQKAALEPVSNTTEKEDKAGVKDSEKVNNTDTQPDEEKEIKTEGTDFADQANSSPELQLTNNQQSANSPPTENMLPLAPPVVIPSHLPRRQRELYLRIQQHQKEADSGTDVSEDPESKTEEEKTENWYSSDEDDTEDQPLTAVLKKLQLTPLPNILQQSGIPTTPSTSTINIAKMLTEIRQQATQKSASNGTNTATNQQKDFWKTLLGGAAPTIKDPRSSASAEHIQAQGKPEIRDPRIRSNAPLAESTVSASPPSRDPRLHRDPRLATRDPRVTSANSVNVTSPNSVTVVEGPSIQLPLPPPLWDSNSAVIKTNNLTPDKPIPYKLRSITTSQPNYSSYVFACESNPKLLNDPRLKKYFKQMSGLLRQQQHLMEDVKSVAPIRDSKSLLEEQAKVFTGKGDQEEHSCAADTWDRIQKPKVDPRVTKIPLSIPRPTGSTTPPLPPMTIVTSTAVNPISTSPINTTVASHLPKSVADPRLTRLFHQSDHRRPALSSEHTPSASVNKPLRLQRKPVGNTSSTSNTIPPLPKQPSEKDSPSCPSGNDSPKAEQSASATEESSAEGSEKKKKLTSYNRKSSMDYASPLSSYEDTSSNCSYNSYNRRPQPSQTAVTSAVTQPNIPQPSNSVSSLDIRTALQESSNQSQATLSFLSSETTSDASAATEHTPSLKEVFKTIDPTASPFC